MKYTSFLTVIATTIALTTWNVADAERLVILHTNDTHSQIEPDEDSNLGGIYRRAVIVDSVRAVEKNVLLVDAGDAVQGSLYFNLYGGKVEQMLMDHMGYDIRILGNHEFDNGADSIAKVMAPVRAEMLCSNYDLKDSPLRPLFKRYSVREYCGKRIGFMAINIDPEGIIAKGKYDNVEYLDAVETANVVAWWLRNMEYCDVVVAVTHIGYIGEEGDGDLNLARQSKGIDVIIGGHSHDLIVPGSGKYQWKVKNAEGKDVIITQMKSKGRYVGEIDIDLDDLSISNRAIVVDSRLDARIDSTMVRMVEPYRAGVDSLMTRTPVGKSKRAMAQDSPELLNWATDVVLQLGSEMADNVDMAILNKGGLRRSLPAGTIHEGQVICTMPFENHIQVIDIKGSDLLEAFYVMACIDGNGVSKGVEISYIPGTEENEYKDARVRCATINGKPIDPEGTYRVATIDYLAEGGDYMEPLTHSTLVASSEHVLYEDVLDYLRNGKGRNKTIKPDGTVRMHK